MFSYSNHSHRTEYNDWIKRLEYPVESTFKRFKFTSVITIYNNTSTTREGQIYERRAIAKIEIILFLS